MARNISHPNQREQNLPPFLGTWPRVYGAVLCYFFVLIVTLYLLTAHFTRFEHATLR